MKTMMKMDVLRCESVAGVRKELAAFGLAYNLVRSVQWESGRRQGVPPERISFTDALRWLGGRDDRPAGVGLWVNPERRGRFEPRVVKRRPKPYPRMTTPRSVLRKSLLDKTDVA